MIFFFLLKISSFLSQLFIDENNETKITLKEHFETSNQKKGLRTFERFSWIETFLQKENFHNFFTHKFFGFLSLFVKSKLFVPLIRINCSPEVNKKTINKVHKNATYLFNEYLSPLAPF